MLRDPAVAGSFYPAEPRELSAQLDRLLVKRRDELPHKAVIVPHAGYVYSGMVAGEVFAATVVPPQVVLFGPNHHGPGCGHRRQRGRCLGHSVG